MALMAAIALTVVVLLMAYGFNSCNGFNGCNDCHNCKKCYELSVIPDMLDTAELKVYEWP